MQFGDELTRAQRLEMDEALDDSRQAANPEFMPKMPEFMPRLYDEEANNTSSFMSFMMREQQLIDQAQLRGLTVAPTLSPVEYSLARPETRSYQPKGPSDGGGRYDRGANATPAPRSLAPKGISDIPGPRLSTQQYQKVVAAMSQPDGPGNYHSPGYSTIKEYTTKGIPPTKGNPASPRIQ
jgi:hypothetical protein